MALTTINSDGVKDDSIVNADIKSDAAIAGSKINPAFTTAASVTAAQPQLQFQDSDGTNQITQVSNSSGHTYIKTRNNTSGGNFYVNTWDNTNSNYPTLFTILNGGNCGIGTTSPAGKLEINAGSSGTDVIVLRLDSDSGGAFNIQCSDASSATPLWKFDLGISEALQIDSAATTRFLSGSGDSSIAIGKTGAANDAVVLKYDESGDKLHFYGWGGSEGDILTLDNGNSRIGIGTTSPFAKFTVFGSGGQEARVAIEGESGADPYINFLANNTQHWSLGVDDSDSDKFKISKHSALGTNDYLTVDTSGNVSLPDGNLVVANTHGIDFSASEGGTGTSNEASILDDYETGTFTPGITFGGSASGITLSSALGSYTKIGRRVFIDFVINVSAKGTASTGTARLSALPFTALNETVVRVHGFCSYYGNMFSLTGRPVLYNPGNATTGVFYDDAASTQTTLNDANFANNSLLRGKIEYTCA